MTNRKNWLLVNQRQIRKDLLVRALELAPPSLYPGGWISTVQLSGLLGVKEKELRPILKELRDIKRINGWHATTTDFWRTKNRMYGDVDS